MQLWAIQSKFGNEDNCAAMVDAFQKLGLNWAAFPLIPFVHHVPDFQWDGPIVYYGSVGLINTVENTPKLREKAVLFYDGDQHMPSSYGPKLGDAWINKHAKAVWLKTPLPMTMFVKPDSSKKLFPGGVFTPEAYKTMVDRLIANGASPVEQVIISPIVEIEREYRTWIVDGEVVAVVGYKIGNTVRPWYWHWLSGNEDESEKVKRYAQAQGENLKELGAFVLDIAVTPDGLKVIEMNDIHASGFYLPDHVIDVVGALSNYVAKIT